MKTRITKLLTAILFFSFLYGCSNNDVTVVCVTDNEEISYNLILGETYSLDTVSKKGYEFKGWFDINGTRYTDNTGSSNGLIMSKKETVYLYPKWEAKECEIKFIYYDANGNLVNKIESIKYGETIYDLFLPENFNGKVFTGWFIKNQQISNEFGVVDSNYKIYLEPFYNESLTEITAVYHNQKINLNFVTSGSAVDSITKEYLETINELPTSKKDNYVFTGWYLDSNYNIPFIMPYTLSNYEETNITLYARFLEPTTDFLSFTRINNDKEYSVSLSMNVKDVVIPESYFGIAVTSIGDFSNNSELTSIILPTTIKEISKNAFSNCPQLKHITIPYGVPAILDNTFSNCINLEKIYLPQSVTRIDENAFLNCQSLTEFTFPANLNSLSNTAFIGTKSIKEYKIDSNNLYISTIDGVVYSKNKKILRLYPAGNTLDIYTVLDTTEKIDENSFIYSKYLREVVVADKTKNIEQSAFSYMESLQKIELPENVETIGNLAFSNSQKLRAVIINRLFPANIGTDIFKNNSLSFSIYVPSERINNYKTISQWNNYANRIYSKNDIFGDYVIEEEPNGVKIKQLLSTSKNVIIPNYINGKNVTTIGALALSDMTSIEMITIPGTVSLIDNNSFYGCTNLKSITLLSSTPPIIFTNTFGSTNDSFEIYVLNDLDVVASYKAANIWNNYSNRIFSIYE